MQHLKLKTLPLEGKGLLLN